MCSAGLTVCVKYIVLHNLCSRNGLLQRTCLQPDQSPLQREACIRAKRGIGGGKWRDLVPSVYPSWPIITVSLTSLVATERWTAQSSHALRCRLQCLI